MNYIIENNIDFYAELNKDCDDEPPNYHHKCLISREPLTYNYVTLSCSHTFNYDCIFDEVIRQKINRKPTEIIRLKPNEIKCPYCRSINLKLLPYIPLDRFKARINQVNHPLKDTMNGSKCDTIIKIGKNKGKLCGHVAFESHHGCLCNKHSNILIRKADKNNHTGHTIENILNKYIIPQLKDLLKKHHLKVGGIKKELIQRIIDHDIPLST